MMSGIKTIEENLKVNISINRVPCLGGTVDMNCASGVTTLCDAWIKHTLEHITCIHKREKN